MRSVLVLAYVALCLVCAPRVATAQARQVFKGRLTALPIDPATALTITGSGSVTAVLVGNTLTIDGTFSGTNSTATSAHVLVARGGLRGPKVFDLTVGNGATGTVSGKLTLNPGQVENLKKGWYYVQIYTEKNPDGQLRGWLLPEKAAQSQ